ncbi:hypothetical protein OIU79_003909 [Salix purpurea]|uniref:Uncharacterized protein n=1 Tax=Salix purpurea TaxID=77065 RepID=A0A9Q0U8Y3_SALPP|nr:hypothetical protein OIU79_003909 [Salix purpurea]
MHQAPIFTLCFLLTSLLHPPPQFYHRHLHFASASRKWNLNGSLLNTSSSLSVQLPSVAALSSSRLSLLSHSREKETPSGLENLSSSASKEVRNKQSEKEIPQLFNLTMMMLTRKSAFRATASDSRVLQQHMEMEAIICGIWQVFWVLCQKETVFNCCLFVQSYGFCWSFPRRLFSKCID